MVDHAPNTGRAGSRWTPRLSATASNRTASSGPNRQPYYYGLRSYVLRSNFPHMKRTSGHRGLRRPNDPPVLILTSLAAGPKHGHALAKDIADFAGVVLGPGALYGAITRLEERGLIEPLGSEDRRRPYRMTAAGSDALASAMRDMRRIVDVGTTRLGLVPGSLT